VRTLELLALPIYVISQLRTTTSASQPLRGRGILARLQRVSVFRFGVVPTGGLDSLLSTCERLLRRNSVRIIGRQEDAIEFEADQEFGVSGERLLAGVRAGSIEAVRTRGDKGYDIRVRLRLHWTYLVFPLCFAVAAGVLLHEYAAVHPRTFYPFIISVPVIHSLLVRMIMARAWGEWLDWAIESNEILGRAGDTGQV